MIERVRGIGMTSERTRMRMVDRLRAAGVQDEAVLAAYGWHEPSDDGPPIDLRHDWPAALREALTAAAIAAEAIVRRGGDQVAVLDVDFHHGNGTQQVFYERGDVVYTSVHIDPGKGWFPHWSGFAEEIGDGPGKGFNHNLPLSPGDGDREMLEAVEELAALVTGTACDALVVSLGVDSGAADENSPLEVTAEGFASVGRMLGSLGLPTVLVQEGGYDLASLERDLTAVLGGLEGALTP